MRLENGAWRGVSRSPRSVFILFAAEAFEADGTGAEFTEGVEHEVDELADAVGEAGDFTASGGAGGTAWNT